MTRRTDFAQALRAGADLVGSFQKTPAYQNVELFARSGVDFVVLDTEHAPFDLAQLDACIMASHLGDLPLLVRIARNAPDAILPVLDMGATGVLVPHVASAEAARRASEAAHYVGGTRGFSPSGRAGGYGTRGLTPYIEQADREVAVVLQIEDAAALDHLDAIARTPGIAGLFVGRADLAVSLNVGWSDPRLDDAVAATAKAARAAGVGAGTYLADFGRLADYRRCGATFFIVGSDQSMMRTEAGRVAQAFRAAPDKA